VNPRDKTLQIEVKQEQIAQACCDDAEKPPEHSKPFLPNFDQGPDHLNACCNLRLLASRLEYLVQAQFALMSISLYLPPQTLYDAILCVVVEYDGFPIQLLHLVVSSFRSRLFCQAPKH
jgi:hypothetical protein